MLRHFVGLAAAGAAAAARAPPAAGAPRGLRATPAPRALGVLEQLTNAAPASLAGGGVCGKSALWEVVEFRAGGAAIETWKSPDGLGLHPRDVSLFTAPRGGAAARALLAPRPGALLLRTEAARAVIQHDRAVLFPGRELRETVRAAQAVKSALAAPPSGLPFELRALEALLAETARAFDAKARRVALVAAAVVEDISKNVTGVASGMELQRLIPVTRRLTELSADVRETLAALEEVADDDDALAAACLTERRRGVLAGGAPLGDEHAHDHDGAHADGAHEHGAAVAHYAPRAPGEGPTAPRRGGAAAAARAAARPRTPHMRLAATILEAYEHKLQGTAGMLAEAQERIDQTREVWAMQLDHQRNRVLRVNLLISTCSLGGLVAAAPAAFFGANVPNPLEATPGAFGGLVAGSAAAGAAVAGAFWLYYKLGPKRRYDARVRDMRSLRDLLTYHLDDLDPLIDAVRVRGALTKKEFSAVVRATVGGRPPISDDEAALLWRVFDTNKNDLLELSEVVRLEEIHHGDNFDNGGSGEARPERRAYEKEL